MKQNKNRQLVSSTRAAAAARRGNSLLSSSYSVVLRFLAPLSFLWFSSMMIPSLVVNRGSSGVHCLLFHRTFRLSSTRRRRNTILVHASPTLSTAAAFVSSSKRRIATKTTAAAFPTLQPLLPFEKKQGASFAWKQPERMNRRALSSSSLSATTTTTSSSAKDTGKQQAKAKRRRPFRLVIVESPSKCKTIQEILDLHVERENLPYDFLVESCMGHVRNLPKTKRDYQAAIKKSASSSSASTSTKKKKKPAQHDFPYSVVGIDLQDNYRPTYVLLPGKEELVASLRGLAQEAEQVLLATDPDREGEAMAWHLMKVLSESSDDDSDNDDEATAKKSKKKTKKKQQQQQEAASRPMLFQRISFTEITADAILDAITTAEEQEQQQSLVAESDNDDNDDDGSRVKVTNLNPSLVQAQETRRILDRLAGFTVSPILWKKITPGLSAGRVQSVGLARIVERERERLEFERTPYSTIKGNFSTACDDSAANDEATLLLEAQLISVNGTVVANAGADFASQGRKLKPESSHKLHLQEESARALMDQLLRDDDSDDDFEWRIVQVKSTTRQQSPPLPYRTSTLQQDAARRLGLSVQDCMRTAQQLYEAGFISYMRTDATHLSTQAVGAIEQAVTSSFGKHQYNPKAVDAASKRGEKTKSKKGAKKNASKFAQEAHEAIRPSVQSGSGGFMARLTDTTLSDAAKSLYDIIYRRTLACGMANRISNQTQIVIEGVHDEMTVQFRASGSVVIEPGYTLAYGNTAATTDDQELQLPKVEEGQELDLRDIVAIGHETQPPPRFTEASLVKELETLGVGRPSTYATIIKVLRDRAYVGNPIIQVDASSNNQTTTTTRRRGKAPVVSGPAISSHRAAGGESFTSGGSGRSGPLVPSLSAFVVNDLLKNYCPSYVDPDFTARMEERLDRIASGELDASEDDRVVYLDEFYAGKNGLAAQVKRIEDAVDSNDARRVRLPALQQQQYQHVNDDSVVEELNEGRDVSLFVGPWGPYVQQLNDNEDNKSPSAALPPELCADISAITPRTLEVLLRAKQSGGMLLGTHPEDGRSILLKTGRYGAFLQWGDDDDEGKTTHSLPKHKAATATIFDSFLDENGSLGENGSSAQGIPGGLTLEEAVGYISLPRTVSTLNDLPITASIGPYGPYLKYNNTFLSLDPQDGDVLTIEKDTADRLVTDGIINGNKSKQRGVVAELGEKEGDAVTVKKGRFGIYLNWKKVNAKIPPEYVDDPSQIPLDEAWELIEQKAASSPTRTRKGRKTSKLPARDDLPPAPKRSLSAYMHFCADKRPEVSKTESSFGAVAKRLSQLWAETKPEDRKPYEDKAASDKLDYEERKRAWEMECMNGSSVKGSPSSSKRKPKGRSKRRKATTSKAKTSNGPKRPKSSYLFFCETKRPELVSQGDFQTLGEISKELGRLWAETTDRSVYESLAAGDKERYIREKEEQKEPISM